MAIHPWMKFYPADWRADPMLRMCSIAARGLWMEMLCLMHEAEPRGSLVVNGEAVSDKQLATLVGVTRRKLNQMCAELERAGVFSRTETGIIYSRRIRRDVEKTEKDQANGRGGGNPSLNPGVNPPLKAQIPEARSQTPEKKDNAASRRKSRLPDDFIPDREVARKLNWSEGRIDEQIQAFFDYALAHNKTYSDWKAAWRNWIRSPYQKQRAENGKDDAKQKWRNAADKLRKHAESGAISEPLDRLLPGPGSGES